MCIFFRLYLRYAYYSMLIHGAVISKTLENFQKKNDDPDVWLEKPCTIRKRHVYTRIENKPQGKKILRFISNSNKKISIRKNVFKRTCA